MNSIKDKVTIDGEKCLNCNQLETKYSGSSMGGGESGHLFDMKCGALHNEYKPHIGYLTKVGFNTWENGNLKLNHIKTVTRMAELKVEKLRINLKTINKNCSLVPDHIVNNE